MIPTKFLSLAPYSTTEILTLLQIFKKTTNLKKPKTNNEKHHHKLPIITAELHKQKVPFMLEITKTLSNSFQKMIRRNSASSVCSGLAWLT